MPFSRLASRNELFLQLSGWLLPVLFLFFSATDLLAAPLSLEVADEVRTILDGAEAPRVVLDREMLLNADLLPEFYRERNYLPVWMDDLGLTAMARQMLDWLRSADEEGLCPEEYHLTRIDPLVELATDYRRYGILFDPAYMARLDLLLSDAFFLYAGHLLEGRVDPSEVHDGWRSRPRKVDLSKLLGYALREGRLAPVLADLIPPHSGYRLLRAELEAYRRISALGGWPQFPAGDVLHPGDLDSRLPLLRLRLQVAGDLSAVDDTPGELFDPAAVAALKAFQLRHGLDADGVLGERTLAALNVPVEARIRQIELNLERWRWLPKELGERHIEVNAADFRLSLWEQERVVMSMPVVVGTAYRKTPVFSARLTHLVFAPYWNVPPTILREDKLPQIKADPSYLRRHHFEIVHGTEGEERLVDPRGVTWRKVSAATFPGQLRMKPGPWNPLGRVKFMLPNGFDVYLHDTPDKHLFGRDARTFSSGCIRIQRPLDLAQYLLGEQGWDCDRLLNAMGRRSPLRADLRRPLPVHILYWTAWVDAMGRLQFREDIYLRDLDLDLALARRRAEPGRTPQSSLPQSVSSGG